MKILQENIEDVNIEILSESDSKGPKQYFIEGVFLQAEVKNKNKRVYPISTMRFAVENYNKEFIETSRGLGELGHPPNPNINAERVSHRIISLREENNNFIGRAKILDTPYGKIAKNLMDEGIKLGVSSRGLGSIKNSNNVDIVQSDYRLITPADIVMEPSGPDCFVSNLMENKEWAWDNGKLIELETQVKEIINNKKDADILIIFNKILNMI